MTKLNKAFSNSLTSDLSEVGANLADAVIDAATEGDLAGIPVVGLILSTVKAGHSISDRLFGAKLSRFLYEAKEVSEADRREAIGRIVSSKEERIRFGDKLLFLLDRLDDDEKAALVGRVFVLLLRETITRDEFFQLAQIVDRAFLPDLKYYAKVGTEDWRQVSMDSGIYDTLVRLGICKIIMQDNASYSQPEKDSKLSNSKGLPVKLSYDLTPIGKIARTQLLPLI